MASEEDSEGGNDGTGFDRGVFRMRTEVEKYRWRSACRRGRGCRG